jgi:hypothetical protein
MILFFCCFTARFSTNLTRKIQISSSFPSKSALFAHTQIYTHIIATTCEQREEEEERAHQHHHRL